MEVEFHLIHPIVSTLDVRRVQKDSNTEELLLDPLLKGTPGGMGTVL